MINILRIYLQDGKTLITYLLRNTNHYIAAMGFSPEFTGFPKFTNLTIFLDLLFLPLIVLFMLYLPFYKKL